MKQTITCDGNTAAARIAYAFSEVAAIFPITPSSPMGELADAWAVHGRKNLFGQKVKVQEMQSEAGAAGAIHGSLTGGALTTTFTASQGLLLMLPNMFKIAGEMQPTVFHVASRSIASQALSIYADHSDVMATRGTGFALLASSNVQEAQDLAVIAHLSTITSRVPFLHFFDGFRTSHQIQKIETIENEILKEMLDMKSVLSFKDTGIRPEKPYVKVGAENPDVYFQGRETVNKYYDAVPQIIKRNMELFKEKTGREYELFSYVGHPEATHIIVSMASATQTVTETVNYLVEKGHKVGAVHVHLYRPFSVSDFLAKLPKTTTHIAVLDRTKEPGSIGEPLYLDVVTAVKNSNWEKEHNVRTYIIGGRYGLSSKEFTPSMVNAIFDHLTVEGFHGFTVGINDDVTHKSIPITKELHTEPHNMVRCKLWGYGSDGTVSANKNAIKIIGEKTNLFVQGHFAYDSKKSGGITVSHLRFGEQPITSEYEVTQPDFVALHKPAYIGRYDILEGIREGGTFLLNATWKPEEVFSKLTKEMQNIIKERNIKVYVIDAFAIAKEKGLDHKISTIMQTAFFKLSEVMPVEDAITAIKERIHTQFKAKGDGIVEQNYDAVDATLAEIKEVPITKTQEFVVKKDLIPNTANRFARNVIEPIMHLKGDTIPVSEMPLDGAIPTGTSKLEKRGVALEVPKWHKEHCIQCGICSLVCPHAAIRLKQIRPGSLITKPEQFETLLSSSKNESGLHMRVQVYPEDCVGCNICYESCPLKDKALTMVPLSQAREEGENENAEFFESLPDNITEGTTIGSVKWSQYRKPYFEFSGACAGCGETPIIKLASQLFGDRMVIANATGCSSIFGGYFPTTPYSKDNTGKGPAWANSLFEDNAEYGLGMRLAINQNRKRLKATIKQVLQTGTTIELRNALEKMVNIWDETDENAEQTVIEIKKHLPSALEQSYGESKPLLEIIDQLKDYLIEKSLWIIGGDGWAYDIGFGGLDHVLAQGLNVNVLVLDNEQYANTGGQASKSTPRGATAKFAEAGKPLPKKNLGMMFMTYGNVYVAEVSMGANRLQLMKALREAESYDGPSIVIAYNGCIAHGFKMKTSQVENKLAVESGYLPLYRYDPRLAADGKDPMQLDSQNKHKTDFNSYILNESRYKKLQNVNPERAKELFALAEKDANTRYTFLGQFQQKKEDKS